MSCKNRVTYVAHEDMSDIKDSSATKYHNQHQKCLVRGEVKVRYARSVQYRLMDAPVHYEVAL